MADALGVYVCLHVCVSISLGVCVYVFVCATWYIRAGDMIHSLMVIGWICECADGSCSRFVCVSVCLSVCGSIRVWSSFTCAVQLVAASGVSVCLCLCLCLCVCVCACLCLCLSMSVCVRVYVTHVSCVRHDLFVCVTWFVHVCGTTHLYVQSSSQLSLVSLCVCVSVCLCVCVSSASCVHRDSFIVAWFVYQHNMSYSNP